MRAIEAQEKAFAASRAFVLSRLFSSSDRRISFRRILSAAGFLAGREGLAVLVTYERRMESSQKPSGAQQLRHLQVQRVSVIPTGRYNSWS